MMSWWQEIVQTVYRDYSVSLNFTSFFTLSPMMVINSHSRSVAFSYFSSFLPEFPWFGCFLAVFILLDPRFGHQCIEDQWTCIYFCVGHTFSSVLWNLLLLVVKWINCCFNNNITSCIKKECGMMGLFTAADWVVQILMLLAHDTS